MPHFEREVPQVYRAEERLLRRWPRVDKWPQRLSDMGAGVCAESRKAAKTRVVRARSGRIQLPSYPRRGTEHTLIRANRPFRVASGSPPVPHRLPETKCRRNAKRSKMEGMAHLIRTPKLGQSRNRSSSANTFARACSLRLRCSLPRRRRARLDPVWMGRGRFQRFRRSRPALLRLMPGRWSDIRWN